MTSRRPDRCSGFTLTELLMVMMVVTILYCISLSAIRAVDRTARKTAARAELKSIETGLKQYYAHYLSWPPLSEGAANESGDRVATLTANFASILNGTDSSTEKNGNPDKLIFVEFARLDKDDHPLNPWGTSGRFPKDDCYYYAAMDTDGDNCVRLPDNPKKEGTPAGDVQGMNAVSLLPSDRRFRGSVIGWTFNPELKADDKDYLLGSWQ